MPTHNSKADLALALAELMTREELEGLYEVAKARATTPPDWTSERRTCSRCGHNGPVDPDFGLRPTPAGPLPQSWCKACRSETAREYRQRQR